MNMDFHFIIEPCDEDGWFVAECPMLPGCVTQAKNMEDLSKNMKEALMLWLETADAIAVEQAQREHKSAISMKLAFV